MMQRIQKIQQREVWSKKCIAAVAALAALVSAVCIYILGVSTSALLDTNWMVLIGPLFVILGFGLPAAILIACHPRLKHWWHALWFGFCYGAGLVLIPAVVANLDILVQSVGNDPLGLAMLLLLPSAGVGVVSGILLLIVWLASRGSRGRLLVLDGACCPQCGYNLAGNTSWVCPECGLPFSLDLLELAPEDLHPA